MSSHPPAYNDSNTIPARFARCVASPEDRDAAILTCVTAVGAHLGRDSALIYDGEKIYPTLYSLILTQPGTLAAWYRWFRFPFLTNPPPVKNSGISRAQAVVHLVRDRVRRFDKVNTGRNADPEWRDTMVDGGVCEKRHLIIQRLAPELSSRTSATARRLRDTLNAGYEDGEMWANVGYRDGGFLGVKGAHIVLLVPEPDERIAAGVCDHLPFLLARAEHAPAEVDRDSMLDDVVSDLIGATQAAALEVTVASEAKRAIQSETPPKRPYAVRTLLRVAHILAVLDSSAIVTEAMLSQARAIVGASELNRESLLQGQHTLLRREILEFVRAAGPDGIAHHELARHFRRRHNSTDDINNTLDELARGQELVPKFAPTSGRDRREWHLPRVQ